MTRRRFLSSLTIAFACAACGSARPVVPDIDASEESDASTTPDGGAPADGGRDATAFSPACVTACQRLAQCGSTKSPCAQGVCGWSCVRPELESGFVACVTDA